VALYTLKLTTGANTETFDRVDSLGLREVERVWRKNVSPNVLVAIVYEWQVEALLGGNTAPATVRSNLATWMTNFAALRTGPTSVEILSGGSAISGIGTISTTGWEDIQITDLAFADAADDPAFLKAHTRVTFTIRGRKPFGDGDSVCEFDQVYATEFDTAGLESRRLVTTVKMVAGVAVTTIASQLKLAKAVGWVRVAPTNTTTGYVLSYPNYPRTDEAVATSIVRRLGGSIALPTGAGDGTIVEEVQDDPRYGVNRKTRRVSIVGLDSPLSGWVNSQEPTGGRGGTTHDKSARRGSGTWITVEAVSTFKGLITRVRARYDLTPGGRPVGFRPMTGGIQPVIVLGDREPARCTETVKLAALAPASLDEVPLPIPLPAPWVLDSTRTVDTMPEIVEEGGAKAMNIWERTIRRSYVWDDPESDPRLNDAFKARAMKQWLDADDASLLA